MPEYRVVLKTNRNRAGFGGNVIWWWLLKSRGNGAILATSEVYSSRRGAVTAASQLAYALDVVVEDET